MELLQSFVDELNDLGNEDRYFVYLHGKFLDNYTNDMHLCTTIKNILLTQNKYTTCELMTLLKDKKCLNYTYEHIAERGLQLLSSVHGFHLSTTVGK